MRQIATPLFRPLSRTVRDPLWNAFGDFDQLFETAFRSPLTAAVSSARSAPPLNPHFSSQEKENAFLLTVDLPGIRREDLQIEVADRTLTISGSRKFEHGDRDEKFQRRFSVPASVDEAKIEAGLQDGVLQIVLPKVPVPQPRAIEVQAGRKDFFSGLVENKEPSPASQSL